MPALENTYLRDGRISEKHREWGFDAPAFDLDAIICTSVSETPEGLQMVEYSESVPVALIEYKFSRWRRDLKHPSIKALGTLGTMAGIPAMVAVYHPGEWLFVVYPLNDQAKSHAKSGQTMSEREFVSMLYRLRGTSVPSDVSARLLDLPDDFR